MCQPVVTYVYLWMSVFLRLQRSRRTSVFIAVRGEKRVKLFRMTAMLAVRRRSGLSSSLYNFGEDRSSIVSAKNSLIEIAVFDQLLLTLWINNSFYIYICYFIANFSTFYSSCQCQCQSKFFSVTKIAELLRSPQRGSRVSVKNQEMIVKLEKSGKA